MALAIDASSPAAKTIPVTASAATTAAFSPPANALLVARFAVQATDSTSAQSVTSVTNTGTALTWHLYKRENATSSDGGSAEAWWAWNASAQTGITVTGNFARVSSASGEQNGGVMAVEVLTGASSDQTTAATGAGGVTTISLPTATLTTTKANSWVWGVVVNWSNSTIGTAGSGQTIDHSVNDTVAGDANWTQRQNATTPTSGTSVTINDTAPSVRHQIVVFEILPATTGTVNTATLTTSGTGMVSLARSVRPTKSVSGAGIVSFAKQIQTARSATGIGAVSLQRQTAHTFVAVSGVGLALLSRTFGRALTASGVGVVSLTKTARHGTFVFGVGGVSRSAQVQGIRSASGTGLASVVKLISKPLTASGVGVVATLISSKAQLLTLTASGIGLASVVKQAQPIRSVTGIGAVSISRAVAETRTATGIGVASVSRQATKTFSATGTGAVSIRRTPSVIKAVTGIGLPSIGRAIAKTKTATGVAVVVLVRSPQHSLSASGTGLVSITSLTIPFVPAGPQSGFIELFRWSLATVDLAGEEIATMTLDAEPVATMELLPARFP